MSKLKPLTPQVFRFVDEYARSKNATEAAIRAGVAASYASEWAGKALDDPRIAKAVEERLLAISNAANVDAVWVLQQWAQIATADPSQIAHVRRVNCRYCNGTGHAYQWSVREFTQHSAEIMSKGGIPPACPGGLGWVHNADPHPDCPECRGEGVPELYIKDLRHLTGPERLLLAGVEQTKEGVKVKFRDQDAAVLRIAEYLGMMVKRGELTGPNGAPLIPGAQRGNLPMVEEVLPDDPKQIEALYLQFTKGSK